ncbi:hypothetical protein [Atopobium sp. oral taxon 810]|uniref:hypothetical protein n=1 Tax=Atopobium sp. oral taxon 810 TaxID=712158 RepID=UPI000400C956|nr:hypothetical protein [Atopobium sp. oral taxon 810]
MKQKSMRLSAIACAVTLIWSLAACGGTQTPAGSNAGSGGTTQTQATKKPAKKVINEDTFVGEWNLVAADMGGAHLAGDISAMDLHSTVTFTKDGKFTMTMENKSTSGKWKLDGEAAVVMPEKSAITTDDDGGEKQNFSFKVNKDDTITVAIDELDMGMTYGKGKNAKIAPEFNPKDGKAITDISQLAGTWKLAGMYKDGASISGDLSMLSMTETTMKINKDGTGEFIFGGDSSPLTVTIDSDGAKLTESSVTVTLTLGEGRLICDSSKIMDGTFEGYLFFEKK